jgi:hypothetical protein
MLHETLPRLLGASGGNSCPIPTPPATRIMKYGNRDICYDATGLEKGMLTRWLGINKLLGPAVLPEEKSIELALSTKSSRQLPQEACARTKHATHKRYHRVRSGSIIFSHLTYYPERLGAPSTEVSFTSEARYPFRGT